MTMMTSPHFEGDAELERILDDVTEYEGVTALVNRVYVCAVCLLPEVAERVVQDAEDDAHYEPVHPVDHDFIALTPQYELRRMIETNAERALWGFGRQLQRLAAEDAELERYGRMIFEEILTDRTRIAARMNALNDLIKAEALHRRDLDEKVKSLNIPGIGRWGTRTQRASWRTDDEAAVLASLAETPDEFALYSQEESRRVLLKDDFKAYLDESGFKAFPGMVRTEEHVTAKGPFDE